MDSSPSFTSLKSIGCLLGIPVLICIAVFLQAGTLAQVLLWLAAIACLFSCFFFLNIMLEDHNVGWSVLVPGSLILCGAAFAAYVALILSGGSNQPHSLVVAVIILGLGGALGTTSSNWGCLMVSL